VALNPASAIKYHTWGQDDASFSRTARLMWRDGGIRPFVKGTAPTIMRDVTFGGVYSVLRNGLLLHLAEGASVILDFVFALFFFFNHYFFSKIFT